MKIAIDVHSVGSQAGGNETYFRQLLAGLAADQSDHEYTLFHAPGTTLAEIGGDPRFRLVPIPRNPVRRICLSLPRRLRAAKPDVFHCQYVLPPWGRPKTVVTIHDLAYEHLPESFHPLERLRMKTLVRRAARQADHILTVSNYSAADIASRYGVPRERVTVTYLAASERFRPREKQASREQLARHYGIDSPFILYVGRVQARKNLVRLVEAYARVRQHGSTPKLVVVGKKDWGSERLLAKISELGLGTEVVFPGYVRYEDLPLFYNAAEVFVFPSLFEGFGLPVVESMASGVPTICSRGSSMEEVAGDGALLIDPLDTAALADALERVLGDAGLRAQLISRGLLRSSGFKAGTLAAQTLEVYRAVGGA
jgi:glycosyltransferase involved in cell wall biosynthesis